MMRMMGAWTPADWLLAALAGVWVGAGVARLAVSDDGAAPIVLDTSLPANPSLPGRVAAPTAEQLILAAHADPFRPDRSLPPVRYRLTDGSETAPRLDAREDRPALFPLRLVGLARVGSTRLAVLDGVPGRATRVYHEGDVLGPLTLDTIAADRVILSGEDTAIVLRIHRPWRANRVR